MHPRTLLPALLPAALLLSTGAWPWQKEDPIAVEVVIPPPPPPAPMLDEDIWRGVLPMDVGELPAGIATASAQSCAACHWAAHDSWASTGHAQGNASKGFVAAVDAVDRPDCWSCHRPLQQQYATLGSWVDGSPGDRTDTPNPAWSATLSTESVTCVACHVRDGHILTPTVVEQAPHPVLHAPQMLTTEMCAGCHQMTWPGADQPLYDTVGEWERSAWATAGVTCLDCHGRPAAGRPGATSHDFSADVKRAMTVLVSLGSDAITRGSDGLAVEVEVINTGSAHSLPTGSPWRGIELRAALRIQPEEGDVVWGPEPLLGRLERTLKSEPPFDTLTDSRLPPGERRVFKGMLAAPVDLPSGVTTVEVTARWVVTGKPDAEPFAAWSVPVTLD